MAPLSRDGHGLEAKHFGRIWRASKPCGSCECLFLSCSQNFPKRTKESRIVFSVAFSYFRRDSRFRRRQSFAVKAKCFDHRCCYCLFSYFHFVDNWAIVVTF